MSVLTMKPHLYTAALTQSISVNESILKENVRKILEEYLQLRSITQNLKCLISSQLLMIDQEKLVYQFIYLQI